MNDRLSFLDSVHAVETASLRGCESPLCSVRFPQTGLQIEPRRFCSGRCRQQASIIRRAAALLVPLGKEKTWELLCSSTPPGCLGVPGGNVRACLCGRGGVPDASPSLESKF